MILEVLCHTGDLLREDADLDLWGTCVRLVRLILGDDLLLTGLLECHTMVGGQKENNSSGLRS